MKAWCCPPNPNLHPQGMCQQASNCRSLLQNDLIPLTTASLHLVVSEASNPPSVSSLSRGRVVVVVVAILLTSARRLTKEGGLRGWRERKSLHLLGKKEMLKANLGNHLDNPNLCSFSRSQQNWTLREHTVFTALKGAGFAWAHLCTGAGCLTPAIEVSP